MLVRGARDTPAAQEEKMGDFGDKLLVIDWAVQMKLSEKSYSIPLTL